MNETAAGREVELEAGRELDALVAERVFGFRWVESIRAVGPFNGGRSYLQRADAATQLVDQRPLDFRYGRVNPVIHDSPAPAYSTDIAAAWDVVEKLSRDGWLVEVMVDCFPDGLPAGSEARLWRNDAGWSQEIKEHADTVPLAIARAALQAQHTPTQRITEHTDG